MMIDVKTYLASPNGSDENKLTADPAKKQEVKEAISNTILNKKLTWTEKANAQVSANVKSKGAESKTKSNSLLTDLTNYSNIKVDNRTKSAKTSKLLDNKFTESRKLERRTISSTKETDKARDLKLFAASNKDGLNIWARKYNTAIKNSTHGTGSNAYINKKEYMDALALSRGRYHNRNLIRYGIGLFHFDDTLEHHGVKGMKWGVRKDSYKSVKEVSGTVANAIPDRYAQEVKTHPNYDKLTDEYMRSVVNRKNLEMSYAQAVGEVKVRPTAGKVAKESLQTIGAIAGIAVAIATIMQGHHKYEQFKIDEAAKDTTKK